MKNLVAGCVLILIWAGVAGAVTVTVPGEFSTINSAIDNCVSGDTILVDPGSYDEIVTYDGKDLVIIGDVADPSTTVIYGTGSTYAVRMNNTETSAAVLEGFQVDGSTYLIQAGNSANPTVRDCILSNATAYPVYLTQGSGINLSDNEYTNNDTEAIYVAAGTIGEDVNYTNDGLPYHMFGTVSVWDYSGNPIPRLTIDPGCELYFATGTGLQIGNTADRGGELYAVGTVSQPITFTALTGISAGWAGIHFNNGSDYLLSESRMEYCIVDKAGGTGWGHAIGVLLTETLQPTFVNSQISNCAGHAMRLNSKAHFAYIDNVTLTNNEFNTIAIPATTFSSDFTYDSNGIPFEVLGDLQVWSYVGNPIPRLTIEPGNTFMFATTAGIQIGSSADRGGELYAVGTYNDPIVFTASSGIPGGWDGIYFANGSDYETSTSRIEFCLIEYAGNTGWGYPAGIVCDDTDEPFVTHSMFENNDGYAVWLQDTAMITMTGNVIEANTYDAVGVSGRTIQDSFTWPRGDVPYHVMGLFYFWDYDTAVEAPTMTIEPGTEILFAETMGLQIGAAANQWGEIYAVGTAQDPIIFGAINGQPGGWGGILFANGSDHNGSESTLSYCQFNDGGYARWYSVQATVSSATTTQPSISNCAFNESSVYPLYIHSDASISITPDNTFTGNGIQAIGFEGRTVGSDYVIHNAGFPYHVIDTIYIHYTTNAPYPTLTIEPGVELRFSEDAGMRIGSGSSYAAQLMAVGTEQMPITMTSFSGAPGGWSGLYFTDASDADGVESAMNWCYVKYAGANLAGFGSTAGIYLYYTSQPTLDNCAFTFSGDLGMKFRNYTGVIEDCRASLNEGDGVEVTSSDFQLVRVEMSGNGDDGIELVNTPDLTIGSGPGATCQIFGNTGYNVRVEAGADSISARYNYWGTLVPTEIEASIYDEQDDPGLGRVKWYPAVDIGQGQDVFITITPFHTPTLIGPGGGYFRFQGTLHNDESFTVQVDAWTEFILPNSTVYGPVELYQDINMPGGYTINVAPFQEVPGYAPNGTYQFVAKIGTYPTATDSSSFEVIKIEYPAAQRWFSGWQTYGWFGDDEFEEEVVLAMLTGGELSTELLPTEFVVGEVYPNPFNAMANLSIALPEAAPVSVVVYNVTGQRVMTVSSGDMAAGYHTLTVDASSLASGFYFVRTAVPGQINAVQKMVVVK